MIEVSGGVRKYSLSKEGNEYFAINGKRTNFQIKEFACNDGSDAIKIDSELVEKLQIMRSYFGVAITINSGYRTSSHNREVGGSPNSQHLLGKAADIVVRGKSPRVVAEFAKRIGFTGIGTYKNFVHVDTRPTPSYWNG